MIKYIVYVQFNCMTIFKEMLFTVVRHTGSTPGSISTSTNTGTIYVLSVLFGVSLFLVVCFYSTHVSKCFNYFLAQHTINLAIFCHYYTYIVRQLIVCRQSLSNLDGLYLIYILIYCCTINPP